MSHAEKLFPFMTTVRFVRYFVIGACGSRTCDLQLTDRRLNNVLYSPFPYSLLYFIYTKLLKEFKKRKQHFGNHFRSHLIPNRPIRTKITPTTLVVFTLVLTTMVPTTTISGSSILWFHTSISSLETINTYSKVMYLWYQQ